MTPRIIATGSCVPDKVVTNDDLARSMDTNDEWIRTRTGIGARRIAEGEPKEKLLRLTREAAERALASAEAQYGEQGFSRQDIGLVIVATCTPDMAFPATACRLQAALSIERAAAFDLSLACTGFLAALSTAFAYIRSGQCKTALVVGADVMSRMIDWSDRSTAVLFGDGAGAVLVSGDDRFLEKLSGMQKDTAAEEDCASEGPVTEAKAADHSRLQKTEDAELPLFRLISDGSGAESLYCRSMFFNEAELQREFMDGRKVFEFAVRKVPEIIGEVLLSASLKREDVKLYILHQANYRIIEAVAKRFKEPIEKFPHNIERYGNTTAGSIPILLDELNREGRLQRGDLLCLSGFGAGLSYGAALLRW